MSQTDTDQTTAPLPNKPKRKRGARKAKPAAAKVAEKSDEFAGMTRFNCAAACHEKNCVVSCRPYCAHPRKGALQSIDMQNRDAIGRLGRAKEFLAQQDG